jgi:hypothetical protein
MRRGGEVGLLKGESVERTEARAMTTVSGSLEVALIAVSTSCSAIGEPVIIVKPGVEVSEEGSRTSAVTAWFFERADVRMRLPVRPVAPRRRICIFGWLGLVGVLRTGCFVRRKGARYVSEDRSSRMKEILLSGKLEHLIWVVE